jgi:hypothetical protein
VRCLAYWNEFRGRRSFPEQVEELNILTTGLLLFSNSQPTPRKPTEAWKNDSQKEGAKEKSEPVKHQHLTCCLYNNNSIHQDSFTAYGKIPPYVRPVKLPQHSKHVLSMSIERVMHLRLRNNTFTMSCPFFPPNKSCPLGGPDRQESRHAD